MSTWCRYLNFIVTSYPFNGAALCKRHKSREKRNLFPKMESLPRKQQTRWNEELNSSISTDDWSTIYKCNYDVTPETKLRSFQIKLNLRAVVTNIVLHGFEITTTDKCTFCNDEKEALLHLFCTCVKVASF